MTFWVHNALNIMTWILPSSCSETTGYHFRNACIRSFIPSLLSIILRQFRFVSSIYCLSSLLCILGFSLCIWILSHDILELWPQCLHRTEFIADLSPSASLVSRSPIKPSPLDIVRHTAITPSSDRFNLLIFANTCSKLSMHSPRQSFYFTLFLLVRELTTAISCSKSSRCCSKNDFSATGAPEAAGGRVVFEAILAWKSQ